MLPLSLRVDCSNKIVLDQYIELRRVQNVRWSIGREETDVYSWLKRFRKVRRLQFNKLRVASDSGVGQRWFKWGKQRHTTTLSNRILMRLKIDWPMMLTKFDINFSRLSRLYLRIYDSFVFIPLFEKPWLLFYPASISQLQFIIKNNTASVIAIRMYFFCKFWNQLD